MKLHHYDRTEVQSNSLWFGNNYWVYDVTSCGIKRMEDDFHIDGAKKPEDVTCKKCLSIMKKKVMEKKMDTNKIREAIDMDEWKNSWHLPKDTNGRVIWFDADTVSQCKSIILEKMSHEIMKLSILQSALDELNSYDVTN